MWPHLFKLINVQFNVKSRKT